MYKLIGLFEVLSALFGFWLSISGFIEKESFSLMNLLVLAYLGLILYAGFMLMTKKRIGYYLSCLNYLSQIPYIITPHFVFTLLSSIIGVFVTFDGELTVRFGLHTIMQKVPEAAAFPHLYGLNLFALALLILVLSCKKYFAQKG